jgi:tRNA dimethylallyltransferase
MAQASHHSSPSSNLIQCPIFLAGPTAVGKSEIALLLAEKIGGEIISVDSMQVYRGLDIGTAKPSTDERARVRHHLIDVVDLTEAFDAAQFLRLANAAVAEIQARGRAPILCGGTGLYFKAFLDGLGDTPSGDAQLRTRLEATPLPELLTELAERDPKTYQRIDRKNLRRVVRAVEVIRLTGRPFSEQRAEWVASESKVQSPSAFASLQRDKQSKVAVGLSRKTDDLRGRIDARVEAMFQRGLVDETRRLLDRGLAENKTAMQALGYRQVVEHLRGERSLPETIELVKTRTRQFAKRQMTWFKRQLPVHWLELSQNDDPRAAVDSILSASKQGLGHSGRCDHSLQ